MLSEALTRIMPIEETGDGLAVKILIMIIGALFTVMTAIGGFTAAHLINQSDELSVRITLVQTQLAANEVARQNLDARLSRIETLLYEARERTK